MLASRQFGPKCGMRNGERQKAYEGTRVRMYGENAKLRMRNAESQISILSGGNQIFKAGGARHD